MAVLPSAFSLAPSLCRPHIEWSWMIYAAFFVVHVLNPIDPIVNYPHNHQFTGGIHKASPNARFILGLPTLYLMLVLNIIMLFSTIKIVWSLMTSSAHFFQMGWTHQSLAHQGPEVFTHPQRSKIRSLKIAASCVTRWPQKEVLIQCHIQGFPRSASPQASSHGTGGSFKPPVTVLASRQDVECRGLALPTIRMVPSQSRSTQSDRRCVVFPDSIFESLWKFGICNISMLLCCCSYNVFDALWDCLALLDPAETERTFRTFPVFVDFQCWTPGTHVLI